MIETGEADWQLAKNKMTERGKYILDHSLWSDCKFLVGIEPNQQEIAAHKLILAMASPVFDVMFHSEITKEDVIAVVDIQPEIFKTMLLYVYTDTVNVQPFDEASELYYAAHKYMMPNLKNICFEYLRKNLNEHTACKALEFGNLFDESLLIKESMSFIQRNTELVINHPKFIDVELPTLVTILDQDNLSVDSEIDLFNAVSTWVAAKCLKKSNIVGKDALCSVAKPAMQKIRFLTMTAAGFSTGPAKSDMLSLTESFAILMNLCSKDNYPMPNGFSTSTKARQDYYK